MKIIQNLIGSLKKLGKCFGVIHQKWIFSYRFVTETNLDYIGPVPAFKYFDKISYLEYQAYCDTFWKKSKRLIFKNRKYKILWPRLYKFISNT